MNTKISYMYRDADNYKIYHSEVLSGEISQQQIEEITACLNDGEYFIPHQVGLAEKRFDTITESDHPWFELHPECDFSHTHENPTIDLSVCKLVDRFKKAKGHWDETAFANYASTMLGQSFSEQ